MLVLSRKESQRIRLGDSIVITVVRVTGDKVRLGIEAPREMLVLRDELKPQNPTRLEADGLKANGLKANGLEANGLEKWGQDSETPGKSIEIQVGEKMQVSPSPVSPPLAGSPLTGSPLAKDLLNADAHCDTATVA
jgi:carbon storage regulator